MTARAANVIAFPLERVRPATPRAEGAPPGLVLIFTGVRIVRHAGELAGELGRAPKARNGGPRRKRGGGRSAR